MLEDLGGDEYVLFDCPGQIELYSHVPAMQQLTQVPQTPTLPLTLTLTPTLTLALSLTTAPALPRTP